MEQFSLLAKIYFWFIIFTFSTAVLAQDDEVLIIKPSEKKDTILVGSFINSFYDFDISAKSFNADMWLWFLYKNKDLDLSNNIEIPKSKEFSMTNKSLEETKGLQWFGMRLRAQVMKDWDVRNYPFDRQSLEVIIESQESDTSEVLFLPDTINSKIDQQFKLPDWIIKSFKLTRFNRVYNSTFGDQELKGTSVYPAVKISLLIQRQFSWLILFKLITGVIIAFMIASSVFFINPLNTDPRFGLCVGGLFAAVGNKYIVEGTIPATTSNTLLDNIHNITFIFIFLIIMLSIISLKYREGESEHKTNISKKIDRYGFFIISISFVILISTFVAQAVNFK